MIKSVAIFGASTRTGECVVAAAIKKGLNVRVLLDYRAERPNGLSKTVEVVEGDILDIQNVKATMEGLDAVIVLWESNKSQDYSSVTCEGLKNIVAVMESLYIKVLSICFPAHTASQSNQGSTDSLDKEDHSRMTRVLESSNLHWVAVVVPRLTDDPATGYTIVRDQSAARPTPVSRPDLAAFLIDCLSMPERYQKTVQIESFVKR